jgi:ribosomal protein S18 acetylase RimI-like enzyme
MQFGVVLNSFLFSSVHAHELGSGASKSPSELIIRPAQLEDISELGDVVTQSFHADSGLSFWFYPLLKLGVCEDLRTRFRSAMPNYTCLLAIKPANQLTGETEQIVGTVELSVRSACYWYLRKRYPYIANLAVTHNYRRKGVASRLLRKCEQIAYSWGFETIYLHVLENNHRAQKLYFCHGYTINQVESSLSSWLIRTPRRLFLQKSL